MSNVIYKGKLKRWNDDKGFGFISHETGKRDVFIHISALKKMSRRPVIGDIIYYEIHTNNDGKNKAVNAKIEGVTPIKPYIKKPKLPQSKNQTSSFLVWIAIILILILGYIGVTVYKTLTKETKLENTDLPSSTNPVKTYTPKKEEYSKYSCDGRVWCSKMTSCDEAKFFINNCPSTKMDSDNDGIPCERQWCNK